MDTVQKKYYEKFKSGILWKMVPDDIQTVIVGVSGGPDSMALLDLLVLLSGEIDFKVIVAHLNHGIRGDEADADEDFVRKYCASRSIEFVSETIDVPKLAKEKKVSLEMAARLARFEFFDRTASRFDYPLVALGHNKNDTVELLFMRLSRGSGGRGLGSLRPFKQADKYILIRPLLSFSRDEILEYLAARCIKYRTDSTNLDLSSDRAKIRNEILPQLISTMEKYIAQGVLDSLARSAELLAEDEGFISYIIAGISDQFCSVDKGNLVLNAPALIKYPSSITGRIFLDAFERNYPGIRLEKIHLDRLHRLINRNEKSVSLPGDLIAELEGNSIVIRPNIDNTESPTPPAPPNPVTIQLANLPCEIRFGNFDIEIKSVPPDFSRTQTPVEQSHWRIVIQPPDNTTSLKVRSVRDGDRMAPLGMDGHTKKLSDIFIDNKIDKRLRPIQPVIVAQPCDEIIALPTLKIISERAKVIDEGKAAVEIHVHVFQRWQE